MPLEKRIAFFGENRNPQEKGVTHVAIIEGELRHEVWTTYNNGRKPPSSFPPGVKLYDIDAARREFAFKEMAINAGRKTAYYSEKHDPNNPAVTHLVMRTDMKNHRVEMAIKEGHALPDALGPDYELMTVEEAQKKYRFKKDLY